MSRSRTLSANYGVTGWIRSFQCMVCVVMILLFANSVVAESQEDPWARVAAVNQMLKVSKVAAPFTEYRYYKFRKEPKVFEGVFRKNEDSISLAYTIPKLQVIHLKGSSIWFDDGKRLRNLDKTRGNFEEIAIMRAVLDWDLKFFQSNFRVEVIDTDGGRNFLFSSRDVPEDLDDSLEFEVQLDSDQVRRISIYKGESLKYEVIIGDCVFPEFYLAEDIEAFFPVDR